jgi:heparan-alpha-glucosaminide N-acetyltransferase
MTLANTEIQQPLNKRVDSVDIMRGLVILTMVFVNDLADFAPVVNVPQWLRHMASGVDGFTFVDLIIPVFMFILGISIPLALGKRLARNEPLPKITGHVLIRVASLIVMGLFDVNRGVNSLGRGYGVMQDWPIGLWKFLAWTFIFIVWLDIPLKSITAVKARKIAGIAGIAGIVWLMVVFRTNDGGTLAIRWWGTLGKLGWAYLVASIAWLVFRNNRLGIVGVFVLLHANYLGMSHGLFSDVWIINVIGNTTLGTASANAVAGLFIGTLLVENSSHMEKIRRALGLSLFAFLAAMLMRPVGGLDSPSTSWSLYATGFGALIWTLLYWSVDVRGWKTGLGYIQTIGSNSLLIYQLSRYWIFIYWFTGLTFYETLGGNLATGIARALAYTVFLGALTVFATGKRVLLRV